MSVPDSSAKRRVRIEGTRGLYQRPNDGKFEALFQLDGKLRSKTLRARTLTEARREHRDLLTALDNDQVVAPARMTFGEGAAEWLVQLEGEVAAGDRGERTLDSYRSHLNHRILPALRHRPIQKITTAECGRLVATWRVSGLSRSTLDVTMVVLESVFKLAVTRAYIPLNPLTRLEKPKRRKATTRQVRRVLSNEEIGKLLEGAGHHLPFVATAVFTGLRQSELVGLRWSEVDFEAGYVYVRHQLARCRKDRERQLVPLKSAESVRDVILLPQLAKILRRHRVASRFSQNADYVFTTRKGRPIEQRHAARIFEDAVDHAGLNGDDQSHMRMHDARHTFASHLILELGLDAVRVSKQLGHSKPSITTDVYAAEFEKARHGDDLRTRMEASDFGRVLDGSFGV